MEKRSEGATQASQLRDMAARVRLPLLDMIPHPDIPAGPVLAAKEAFERYVNAVDTVMLEAAQILEEEAGTVAVCMYCDRRAAWKSDERKDLYLRIASQLRGNAAPNPHSPAPLPRSPHGEDVTHD